MAKTGEAKGKGAPAARESSGPAKLTWDEFTGLVKRAESGDWDALSRLRTALDSGEYPKWSSWLQECYGNPAELLKSSLATTAAGEERLATWQASEIKMDAVEAALAGPDPTPIERLLAERAAVCWFAVNLYENLYNQPRDLTIRQAEYQLRRIESAHKRFLSAVATLARVRKLALPALQVNIGTNQVNVSHAES